MDNGAYTEESLKKISIHDLRVIMRSVGGTPSTLNKKQLIEEILKIQKKKKSDFRLFWPTVG